jgi:hypothetical protein
MPSSFPLVRVVGMHFRGAGAKDYAAALVGGEALLLEREPENQFDSMAIKVLTPGEHSFHLGYIERGAASWIAAEMDEGFEFDCIVHDTIQDKNNIYPRVNITPKL